MKLSSHLKYVIAIYTDHHQHSADMLTRWSKGLSAETYKTHYRITVDAERQTDVTVVIQGGTLVQDRFQAWGFCLLIGPPCSDMKMWVFPHRRVTIDNAGGGLCSEWNDTDCHQVQPPAQSRTSDAQWNMACERKTGRRKEGT